ncbi:MAG: hypothetical protein ACLU38_04985 [Dysosmobacter sp.]
MFLIVRAIGNERSEIQNSITQLVKISKSVFTLQKYEFADIEYSNFSLLLSKVSKSSIKALVKEEKVENLQNQLLPQCLGFSIGFHKASVGWIGLSIRLSIIPIAQFPCNSFRLS